jgi:HSP20 family protein
MVNTEEVKTATCAVRPFHEIEEKQDAFEVRVYMPGVAKDGATISLGDNELIVTGKKVGTTSESWREISRESRCGDYELRLELNVAVDGEHIAARTENGVLYLTLPKAGNAKPRRIVIQ